MKNSIFLRWLHKKQRMVWLEYAGLALFILLPLLGSGYILTLDLVFTPHFSLPSEVTNTYLLQCLLWLLHFILPGDVIEKMVLFAILLLSGVGMHLLARSFRPKVISREFWNVAMYFAGLLYMINPFTYSHFMAGQWMVLLGYALLPFFVRSFLALLQAPSRKLALEVFLFIAAISIVSLHHTGIVLCVGVLIVVAGIIKYRHDSSHLKRFFTWIGASVLAFIVTSFYWIIPALIGHGRIAESVSSFNQAHFEAFKTNGSGAFGAIGEVVRMQGFWAEAQKLFALPQTIVPVWGLIVLLLWLIVIVGAKKAWRHNRLVVGVAVGSILIGTVLAGTPLIDWLKDIVPFAAGYREPQKFTNLVVLGYALLGAFGVGYILQTAAKKFGTNSVKIISILCMLLPFLITPTMLWGFSGQLSPRTYPKEWTEMNSMLKNKKEAVKVLFLPWHEYANYSFSGRLIANPAEKFFEVPVIISDEPEFRGAPPTYPNDEKRQISALLKNKQAISPTLARLHINYILVAKEQNYTDYGYLSKASGLQRVLENEKLKLYKVGE